jgi:hypothetical protein
MCIGVLIWRLLIALLLLVVVQLFVTSFGAIAHHHHASKAFSGRRMSFLVSGEAHAAIMLDFASVVDDEGLSRVIRSLFRVTTVCSE